MLFMIATQICVNKCIVHPCNGTLHVSNNEQPADMCSSIGGSQQHYAK